MEKYILHVKIILSPKIGFQKLSFKHSTGLRGMLFRLNLRKPFVAHANFCLCYINNFAFQPERCMTDLQPDSGLYIAGHYTDHYIP